jgi:diaminopropionate ammonia-lyase
VNTDFSANPLRDPAWRPEPGLEAQARALHERLDGYAPTPLHSLPSLAAELGLGRVLLKDESARFGLPAFKALGAFWAAHWAVEQSGRPAAELTLVCATEGNHGRAVARAAGRLGARAHVVIPAHTAPARANAIVSEGAHVERIAGGYEDAVAHAASLAGGDRLVVSDTAWPGYEEIPRRVVEGYATMFGELGGEPVDLVVVPIGVGSLAAAAARHFRAAAGGPFLLGLEPLDAACALASARAGSLVTVPGPMRSIMAGLNCATPSPAAWPLLAAAYDAFCAVDDAYVRWGMRRLAAEGLDRGACSGGVLGGLRAHRAELDLPADATALLILTEGVTDPAVFTDAVGRPPADDFRVAAASKHP